MTPQELVEQVYTAGGYRRAVQQALRHTRGDQDAAEDLVQETAIKVYRQPARVLDNPWAYWAVALRSSAVNEWRLERQRARIEHRFAAERPPRPVQAEDRAVAGELAETVILAIETQLTPRQRVAITAHIVGDVSQDRPERGRLKVLRLQARKRLRVAIGVAT